MAVNLQKGQKVDLTKGRAGLSKVIVGLGWDTNKFDGPDFDLDASAFLLNQEGKCTSPQDFVYYNQLSHVSGSVVHQGDNLTGVGEGDDEQIKIDLSAVPSAISKIGITVTIHEAKERKQNFGLVSNAFVRIVDENTGQEIIRYDLSEDYSIETALVFCELYRHGAEWKFAAVGSGFNDGLAGLCRMYGLDV
ncbi:stress protein [Desulfofarcimen acetoxidans DSM 771]|jgi:tellurium resistance protein TerD|uniref:Stress protein n=1 Tax=Desulfofarcimen acetoxidans (strain ATCC 49208 / DSM 771 / KCTC 5769 / VKM B-1644 / 5575) TaxID=485916 RepID=C8W640_DESAS|nr:TerD family protein [Desulfofarcimen acetoxidans]ACV61495.1 stress protein [Desulfofarcimen acetoxidans DSM 771]